MQRIVPYVNVLIQRAQIILTNELRRYSQNEAQCLVLAMNEIPSGTTRASAVWRNSVLFWISQLGPVIHDIIVMSVFVFEETGAC